MKELERLVYGLYGKKILYQPIDHPDFSDWKVDRPCVDRLKAITGFMGDVGGNSVLDIGCCTGWFCHKLAKMRANVIGLDVDEKRIRIAKMLSGYYGFGPGNPRFLNLRFQDYLPKAHVFDFVLLLNLIHHLIKRNPEMTWKEVDQISKHTDTMFMDVGTYNIPMRGEEVPNIIVSRTSFNRYEKLPLQSIRGSYHQSKPERPLYVLVK